MILVLCLMYNLIDLLKQSHALVTKLIEALPDTDKYMKPGVLSDRGHARIKSTLKVAHDANAESLLIRSVPLWSGSDLITSVRGVGGCNPGGGGNRPPKI